MATKITKDGYGQVEPNHLSGQITGQIYAQLPAATSIDELENGMFAKYDYANGEVNFTGAGEFMLVFNEVKLYDDEAHMEFYKDFVMKKADYVDGVMTPRLIKTNVGDIFTTNCFEDEPTLSVGNVLKVNANGYLAADGTGAEEFTVVKEYTLADGQPAVKVQRTK